MSGDKLTFSVRIRRVTYGDNRVFRDYCIIMRKDRVPVGIEAGPRRVTKTAKQAIIAARERIAQLKARELYAIPVTRLCINIGDARSCRSCAIAQAIYFNQERMGLDKGDYDFNVVPYACFVEADGIVMFKHPYRVEMRNMPDLVAVAKDGHIWSESMMEWAMGWDDWMDSQVAPDSWREDHEGEEVPYRPSPCSFVLDMTFFKEKLAAEKARNA